MTIPKPLPTPPRPRRRIQRSAWPRRARVGRARGAEALSDHRKMVKEADKQFSLYIRERDGRCRLCGTLNDLQCAHLVSRRYRATRWDPENAWALCRREHMYYTHHPIEWDDLLTDRLGEETYKWLKVRAQTAKAGIDVALVISWLRSSRKESSRKASV